MADKVAFLVLTYDSFEKNSLMQKFFSPESSHLFNLYIHSKDCSLDNSFVENLIPESYIVQTQWGHYSLVLATIRLMRYALEHDAENKIFILISGSHVPLWNMETIYQRLFKHFSETSFDLQQNSDNSRFIDWRFDRLLNKERVNFSPFKRESAQFISQWFSCSREHAYLFVNNEVKLRKWFNTHDISFADEMYFALLANHFNLKYQIKKNCYWNWNSKSSKRLIDQGHRERPKTYSKITNKMIDILRNKDILFLRKVYKDTILDEDYLLC